MDLLPGFLFIDHVALAVKPGEMSAHVARYRGLGFEVVHEEEVLGRDQVREVMLRAGGSENLIQLLEPLTSESPIAKLIEKNGGRGGFAHMAYRVRSARQAFDAMKAQGFQILDEAPRRGSRGTTIFFVHPRELGYLLEIVEAPL